MIWLVRFGLAWSYCAFALCTAVFCEDLLNGAYILALLMLVCLVINAVCVASYTNTLGYEKEQEAQK